MLCTYITYFLSRLNFDIFLVLLSRYFYKILLGYNYEVFSQ